MENYSKECGIVFKKSPEIIDKLPKFVCVVHPTALEIINIDCVPACVYRD